jgi:hypothetical protein
MPQLDVKPVPTLVSNFTKDTYESFTDSLKATYHKTLKELQVYGYVKYSPSYHPVKASEVIMLDPTTDNDEHEQAVS